MHYLDEKEILSLLKNEFSCWEENTDYFISKMAIMRTGSLYIYKDIRNAIIKEIGNKWNQHDISWLINYLNHNLSDDNKENWQLLNEVAVLLRRWNIIFKENDLIDLLDQVPLFGKALDNILDNTNYYNHYNEANWLIEMYAKYKERTILKVEKKVSNVNSLYLYYEDLANYPSLSNAETIEYFQKLLENEDNQEYIQRIVEGNLRLIIKMAKSMENEYYPLNDLIQDGNVFLLETIRKFDLSLDCHFSTFVYNFIHGKLIRSMREKGRIIKISEFYIKNYMLIKDAKAKLNELLNREPTVEEISERTNLSVKVIKSTEKYCQKVLFWEDVKDRESIEEEKDFLEEINQYDMKDIIQESLSDLSEKEEFIIRSHFGLPKENGDNTYFLRAHSLQEVADFMGLAKSYVHYLEGKIFEKLRKNRKIKDLGDAWFGDDDIYFVNYFTSDEMPYAISIINRLQKWEQHLLRLRFGENLDTLNNLNKDDRKKVYLIVQKIKTMVLELTNNNDMKLTRTK